MPLVDCAGDIGQYSAASPRRSRRGLLACAVLATGIVAGLFGASRDALAACTVTAAPNVVTCTNTTTTNTTNTNAGTALSSDREQLFNAGGAVTATVSGGATIDGFGLALTNTQAPVGAGDITFTNSGAVAVSSGNSPTHGGISAVNLNGRGGTITYTGNGSVSGVSGIAATTVGSGAVTVTAGAITTFGGLAIAADAVDGLVTVNVQGALNGLVAGGGIDASSSGTGGVTVTTTAAGSINSASGYGIQLHTEGTGGNLSATTAGVIVTGTGVGLRGIDAEIFNTANAGTIHITANADVSANVEGLYATSNGTGAVTVDGSGNVVGGSGIAGIFANQFNNAVSTVAGVHVGGTGNTTATGSGGTGISATITGANNAGNVLVDRSGAVSGANGINASTAGSGTVTVTAANNVAGTSGSGIFTSATTGLTTVNIDGGVTRGSTNAINATATSGNLAITNNATLQNFSGLLTGQVVSASTNGGNTFTNNGTMTGNVTMTAGTTTFNNTSIWNTLGASTFSGGTSTLINTGAINAPGVAAFNGLTTLTNQSGSVLNLSGGAAPGALTVGGNVTFQSGSNYRIQVNPAVASMLTATGAVTLAGGTVQAVFTPGSYMSKTYTIITAGSLTGTFASVVNTDLPGNTHDTLSYDATHAYLNLVVDFSIPGGLNANQTDVGNALTNFFISNGGIPTVFAALSAAGLSQAAGETATGSQQTTFDAMTQFMGLMTDPFVEGRGAALTPGSGAAPYAEESDALAYATKRKSGNSERDAYAMFSKAPMRTNYDPRWSVWAAGFGGSQTTDGNSALGSNNTRSSLGAIAVGADYVFSPRTIAGFALAGGGTSFSVNNGGSGHSDLFQVGAFVRHTVGQAYITGALAYGWQDVTTNRNVTIAGLDMLRARFNANAYSGRVEGGYRFVAPWMDGIGITPYAAGQFTTFDLPAYAEQVVAGANTFALAYGARTVTAPRSEIGVRTDKSWAMPNAIITLRGRLAWAYDYNTERSVGATFQTLPGASFVVNGAAQSHDKALTTASAEVKWINGWSAAATFEGEFSDVSESYAGKGVVRYQW